MVGEQPLKVYNIERIVTIVKIIHNRLIWFGNNPLKVYNIERIVTKPDEPVVYYLYDGPKRGFVREELMVVPPDTQLPPISL